MSSVSAFPAGAATSLPPRPFSRHGHFLLRSSRFCSSVSSPYGSQAASLSSITPTLWASSTTLLIQLKGTRLAGTACPRKPSTPTPRSPFISRLWPPSRRLSPPAKDRPTPSEGETGRRSVGLPPSREGRSSFLPGQRGDSWAWVPNARPHSPFPFLPMLADSAVSAR